MRPSTAAWAASVRHAVSTTSAARSTAAFAAGRSGVASAMARSLPTGPESGSQRSGRASGRSAVVGRVAWWPWGRRRSARWWSWIGGDGGGRGRWPRRWAGWWRRAARSRWTPGATEVEPWVSTTCWRLSATACALSRHCPSSFVEQRVADEVGAVGGQVHAVAGAHLQLLAVAVGERGVRPVRRRRGDRAGRRTWRSVRRRPRTGSPRRCRARRPPASSRAARAGRPSRACARWR